MIYRLNIQVSGTGETFIHLPAGRVTGVIFDITTAQDTDLIGLKTSDDYVIPLSPVFVLRRIPGIEWKKNIIPVNIDTSTLPRLVYDTSATVILNIYFFINEETVPQFYFKTNILRPSMFSTDKIFRFTPLGKLTGIDLVSLTRSIDWTLTNGSVLYLNKHTESADWTQKKQFFTEILFPVKTEDKALQIEVSSLNTDDVFFLIYIYEKFDK